jgi:hypothetical protein
MREETEARQGGIGGRAGRGKIGGREGGIKEGRGGRRLRR